METDLYLLIMGMTSMILAVIILRTLSSPSTIIEVLCMLLFTIVGMVSMVLSVFMSNDNKGEKK